MGQNQRTAGFARKYTVAAFHLGYSPELQKQKWRSTACENFKRNAYGRVADTLGIERYQSVPLYLLTDTLVPERYGQDGELTRFIEDGEKFIKAEPMFTGDEWMIPKKYVKVIGDTIVFNKAVFVDRHNQNIASLERSGKGQWVVRSMNPSTTGRHLPRMHRKLL